MEHSPERCRLKSIQAVEVVLQMGSRLTNVQPHEKDGRVTISLAVWSDVTRGLELPTLGSEKGTIG